MNEIICVIVPVYNVEKCVNKCVDSIIAQTYQNFHVILVDDGSTDNSGKICDEYAAVNDNITVLHKKNGGLSDARNYALDYIRDSNDYKYITFIDSDDYIEKHYFEELYKTALQYDADIVLSGIHDVYDYETELPHYQSYLTSILTREEAYKRVLLQIGCDVSAHHKLYKKYIFEELRYPKGKLYEDIQIITDIIEMAEKIAITDYEGYCYVQRIGSIMNSGMSEDKYILIDTAQLLIEFMKKFYPNVVDIAIKRYVYCNFHLLGRSIVNRENIHFSKRMKKNILKYRKKIYKSEYYSNKEKMATLFLSIGLPFYKMMWSIFCKFKNHK